jgi:hypothetical protein
VVSAEKCLPANTCGTQCRPHFQTEAFLVESIGVLKNLISALRFVEDRAEQVVSQDSLSDISRRKQAETLRKLTAFKQNPEAHESMHSMLRYRT